MSKILLDNVTVNYPLYGNQTYSWRRSLINWASSGKVFKQERTIKSYTALQNISLELQNGDRLGIIGCNGAGKTTLLRTLGKWYVPASGNISIDGRVTALFDTCLGMDMERTGEQNIFYMGMLMGMSRQHLNSSYNDIIDFAQIGDFLQQPVRTYSAGMKVRLGFAISTCLQPSILLLEEGIGAGDWRFIQKAANRAKSLYHRADILVIASHSGHIIREFCNKVLWLDKGKIVMLGEVETVLAAYENFSLTNTENTNV
jgi:ABC-type polysaccharide/polyol phosphate transport system ATPase subunit